MSGKKRSAGLAPLEQWTTPLDIGGRVMREWLRGRLLTGGLSYPWRIPFKVPSTQAMASQFEVVRLWIKVLAEGAKTENPAAESPVTEKSRAGNRFGYRLEFQEIHHRQLGRNHVPVAAWIDTAEDALALVGKRHEAARFHELSRGIVQAFPPLRAWIERRPLRVLELADEWPALLGALRWVAAHPRPGVYLRQIDAPGVHSKFIERQRAVLAEMLDLILPVDAIDASAPRGVAGFEQRYGFRAKPALIRFRLAAGAGKLQGLSDLSVPGAEFARLALPVDRIFITENEVNFLALPLPPGSMAVFGAGYGFEALAEAAWLHDKALFYWGDIDTHGFAILDQLRAHFPQTRSLLMDRATLMAHQALWGREDTPVQRELMRLRPEEASLYDDLRHDRIGTAPRLEQERIGFAWVQAALADCR